MPETSFPSRVENLLACILHHFPHHNLSRARGLAEEADYDVTQACSRMSSLKLRRKKDGGVNIEEQFVPRSAAPLLRRRLAAIRRKDAWALIKADAEANETIAEVRRKAVEELDLWEEVSVTSHIAGVEAAAFEQQDVWLLEVKVTEKAVEIASGGRRQKNEWQDEAVVEVIYLWAQLAEKRPRDPGSEPKTPLNEKGTMTGFVKDALNIYADRGLSQAWPGTSHSSWSRILLKYREQFS